MHHRLCIFTRVRLLVLSILQLAGLVKNRGASVLKQRAELHFIETASYGHSFFNVHKELYTVAG